MSTEAARAIEAILMVAQEPVDPHLLAQLLEVAPVVVDELCEQIQAEYVAAQRGFCLVKVAGGYRFQSNPDLAPYVERFALEGQSARLSSAALETLAIVAYKQPLSRAQIAAIRGVNVDGVMRTLQQRGYVTEVGRDSGPGQATLFGTSREFLERMGLDRIEDLPPIAELFPSAEIMEALELTLRATPPDPPATGAATADSAASTAPTGPGAATVPEAPTDPGAPSARTPDPADPTAPTGDSTDSGGSTDSSADAIGGSTDLDDDLPEPQPPAWAVDPPRSTGAAPADVDGDGQPDVSIEP